MSNSNDSRQCVAARLEDGFTFLMGFLMGTKNLSNPQLEIELEDMWKNIKYLLSRCEDVCHCYDDFTKTIP